MVPDILTQLRHSSPEKRIELLQNNYQKNRNFFKRKFKSIDGFIERTRNPYRIDVTQNFLEVVHVDTNKGVYSDIGLDNLAEVMGQWTHEGWIDLVNFNTHIHENFPLHQKPLKIFLDGLTSRCPKAVGNRKKGQLSLKKLDDRKYFSPPVVFLGLFHGLHIARYLATTELSTALFIEPDPERFELSCYFLDYEAIEAQLGELNIYCGNEPKSFLIKNFFQDYYVSRHIWLRILPGYESSQFAHFVDNLKVFFTTMTYSKMLLDDELSGIRNGLSNLKKKCKILSAYPRPMAKNSAIVIVASGPSLDNDIQWLKEHRENLIVFAVHSSVRALRDHGITPDFQFSLEMNKGKDVADKLQLFKEVPLISFYKSGQAFFDAIDDVYLCAEKFKANPIKFKVLLENTHPSTTNLAFSFACFLKPATIYMLGCDFGARIGGPGHASGTFQREAERHGGSSIGVESTALMALANFEATGRVGTNPFLNAARVGIEKAIHNHLTAETRVVNFSDGARVEGAIPTSSKNCLPEDYQQKERDLKNINSLFKKSRKKVNWTPYPKTGVQVLKQMKKMILRNLQLEPFDWRQFAVNMDKSVLQAVRTMYQRNSDDLRMEAFHQLFRDIMYIWYGFTILLDDTGEAEQLYADGMEMLHHALKEVRWPDEFDDL